MPQVFGNQPAPTTNSFPAVQYHIISIKIAVSRPPFRGVRGNVDGPRVLPAAEVLYAQARVRAALRPTDFLLDLYCGMGTIGLSMLPDCRRLLGVEIVPQAVEGAKATAARLGLPPERADFRCQDAGTAAAQLAAEGIRPDVIVVDPPRKGCDAATLQALEDMAPRTIVMVSCNAATAARDTRWLTDHGYQASEVQPVDLFPRTRHVEAIVTLHRK